jgi:hypothetical protein
LHDGVVGDQTDRTVALHDDDVLALGRAKFAQDVQIVVDRPRSRTRQNGTTERCC